MGFWSASAAGLGMFLSAEALMLLGNGVGLAGISFLLALAVAALVHGLGACYLFGRFSGPADEIRLLQKVLGPTAALAVPAAGRVALALVAATALMAISGFVFNEVFFLSFPNFLFAFLFLGLIVIVNLTGPKIWNGFQITAIAVVLIGLGLLICFGLLRSPSTALVESAFTVKGFGLTALLTAALLPIGYELGFLAGGQASQPSRRGPVAALLVGSLCLILWGWLSAHWVPRATLAETTIPHMLTARTILGQEGRIIMGVVVLAGAGAAVNALIGGVAGMFRAMGSAGLLPGGMNPNRFRARLPALLLGAATAAMLALGVAGSDNLTVFLQTGLVLWLLHHAVLHWSAFIIGRHDRDPPGRLAAHLSGALSFGCIGAGMLAGGENRATALMFILVVGGSALILAKLLMVLTFRIGPGAEPPHYSFEEGGSHESKKMDADAVDGQCGGDNRVYACSGPADRSPHDYRNAGRDA